MKGRWRVLVIALSCLGVAALALSVPAGEASNVPSPKPDEAARCQAHGWTLVGEYQIVSGVDDFAGPDTVVFPGAVQQVAREIVDPLYYITAGKAYFTTCAGTDSGPILDVEVAINQQAGTQLHAIGSRVP